MKRLIHYEFPPLKLLTIRISDGFTACMVAAMHNSGGGRLLFKEALQADPDDLPEQPTRSKP